ncbi:MAG: GNAT family N-acetyltransferase [Bacteroidia bacterium]
MIQTAMRTYKCLNINQFTEGKYSLVPIRDKDKYDILNWRNAQIDILRQKAPLTKEEQEHYFKTTVSQLFDKDKPNQILWSFLEEDKLIGYGGLVHIDWENKSAEISFLTETSRNQTSEQFISDWTKYLSLIKKTAEALNFNSIYTYAYDIRPNLYIALGNSGFKETKRIKNYIEINGELKDVVIHTYYLQDIHWRFANLSDTEQYFKWANDPLVRQNSFHSDEINYQQHVNWFKNKLNSADCYFYFFLKGENTPIGQVRIDKSNNEIIIGISIDENFRGKGLGVEMLNQSCTDYLSKFPGREIIAYIKEENLASINQFTKAGFIKTQSVIVNDHKSFRFKKNK